MTSKAENQTRFGVPENSMVFARGVRKAFGTLEVLKGIDLNVPTGSVACIIGPSGSGKSTFLRCIPHLEEVSGGVLLVDGEFVGYDLRDGKLYEVKNSLLCRRRADIGMVFQSFNLFSHMTALENLIEAPITVKGMPRGEAVNKARALLERVGLSDKAGYYPRQLSGGQQQRVAIARALAMNPK
ncbi:amino acid ABC transporter ATP-binding protein, partial [Rhizobiaceae sp. 2RAB30]